jgi:hypothetical protein
MHYFLAAILAIAGVAILVWHKPLSEKLGIFYSQRFGATFGKLAHVLGLDNPNAPFTKLMYRGFVITAGIIFLVFAFTAFFGPIQTASGVQQTDSLLQHEQH